MSYDKGKGEVHIEMSIQVEVRPRKKYKGGGVQNLRGTEPVALQAAIDIPAEEATKWNYSMTQHRLKELMSTQFLGRVMTAMHQAAEEVIPKEPHTAKIYWTETVNYEASVQIDVPQGQDPHEYIHSYVLDGSDNQWLRLVSRGPDNCRCSHIDSVDERQVRHIDEVKKKGKE